MKKNRVVSTIQADKKGGVSQFGGKRKWAIFARRKTEIFDFLRWKLEFIHERKGILGNYKGGNRKQILKAP